MRRRFFLGFAGLCLVQICGCAESEKATDINYVDASPDAKDSGAKDAIADSTVSDAPADTTTDSAVDSGSADSGVDSTTDSSTADSAVDSATVDTGPLDSSMPDSAKPDSAIVDSGLDSSSVDSSKPDGSTDSALDTASDSPTDASPPSLIHISEVYVDLALQGDRYEWIEIAAPPGTALDDFMIRHYQWSSASLPTVLKFDLPIASAGTVMSSKGLWVVGGQLASYTDRSYSIAKPDNWGIDGTAGFIQLYRIAGQELVDTIGYGKAQAATAPVAPFALMFGSPAALGLSGSTNQSTGRKTGPSVGNNSLDFCPQSPTPGTANGPCL